VKAIMYDYSNLLGAMRQRGITQKSLAKSIGKSEATINRKLCGAREFTQSEMFKILEIMGEPVERASFYFFTH
jgi:transcriptional regulator with XRE-family HTH domain